MLSHPSGVIENTDLWPSMTFQPERSLPLKMAFRPSGRSLMLRKRTALWPPEVNVIAPRPGPEGLDDASAVKELHLPLPLEESFLLCELLPQKPIDAEAFSSINASPWTSQSPNSVVVEIELSLPEGASSVPSLTVHAAPALDFQP